MRRITCNNCGVEYDNAQGYKCPNCGYDNYIKEESRVVENPIFNSNANKSINYNNTSNSGLALIGFILSFFLSVPGLIVSIVALKSITPEDKGNSKVLAILGIVISSVKITLFITFIFLVSMFFSLNTPDDVINKIFNNNNDYTYECKNATSCEYIENESIYKCEYIDENNKSHSVYCEKDNTSSYNSEDFDDINEDIDIDSNY